MTQQQMPNRFAKMGEALLSFQEIHLTEEHGDPIIPSPDHEAKFASGVQARSAPRCLSVVPVAQFSGQRGCHKRRGLGESWETT
jgi:hypothetical protein